MAQGHDAEKYGFHAAVPGGAAVGCSTVTDTVLTAYLNQWPSQPWRGASTITSTSTSLNCPTTCCSMPGSCAQTQGGKPCVYVGLTGLDPDVRFDKHKAGIQANRYAQEFGLRLLPELYELYNPLTYDDCKLKNSPLFLGVSKILLHRHLLRLLDIHQSRPGGRHASQYQERKS
jgi:hypothetical protein